MSKLEVTTSNKTANTFVPSLTVIVLALATVIAYPPMHTNVTHLNHSGYESVELACSLASGHGFSDPFWVTRTGPSAHLAPLFPAFLAVMIKIAPGPADAYFLMECAATAVVFLQLCLLPLVSKRFGFGMAPGFIAAFLWLAARVQRDVVWEQNYLGVIICALALLMYSSFNQPFSNRRSIIYGVIWGLTLLLSPVVVLALIAWAAVLYFARKQAVSRIATLLLVSLIVVSPWIVRNYLVFHGFVFVRDNLGTELEVSNNPCASFSFELTTLSGCFALHHPNENREQAARVASLGEAAYNHQQLATVRNWIKSNPGAFATLTMKRAVAFWVPSVLGAELSGIEDASLRSRWRDALVSISSLIAVLGLLMAWKTNRAAITVFAIWLTTFPLIYYITEYVERYRTPLMWAILLPAGVGLTELGRSLVAKSRPVASTEIDAEPEMANSTESD